MIKEARNQKLQEAPSTSGMVPKNFRLVQKDEFFAVIGPLDVVTSIEGKYPYTSIFKDRRSRKEIGRINEKHEYLLVCHDFPA